MEIEGFEIISVEEHKIKVERLEWLIKHTSVKDNREFLLWQYKRLKKLLDARLAKANPEPKRKMKDEMINLGNALVIVLKVINKTNWKEVKRIREELDMTLSTLEEAMNTVEKFLDDNFEE